MRPLHVVGELLRKGYDPTVLTLGHWDKTLEDRQYGAETGTQVRISEVHLYRIVLLLRKLSSCMRQSAAGRKRGPCKLMLSLLLRGIEMLLRVLDAPLCELGILFQGIYLAVRSRPDSIFCSSPPFHTLVGSALLARTVRVPLVADLRDLWTLNEYFELRSAAKMYRWFENCAERFVLKSAKRVIYNTDAAKTMMDAKYPALSARSTAITNGILVDTGNASARTDSDGPFTIVHTGTIYLDRDPGDFIDGLGEWMERREDVRGRVEVKLVGRGSQKIADRAAAQGHPARIEAFGQMNKSELAQIISASDLLLLCLGYREKSAYVVPAKMYDYIAARKPIIAYAPRNGEVHRLMNEIGLGDNVVVEPDSGRTAEILDREYHRFIGGEESFSAPTEVIERYKYAAIAGRIEQVIAETVETR